METEKEKPQKKHASGRKKTGRHTKVLRRVLRERSDIDPLTKSTLLGLTLAWDRIEETGQSLSTVPAISKELREIWTRFAPIDALEDIWKL